MKAIKNILLVFFKNKNNCLHKHALKTCDMGYCPDCGEYLVRNYYIIRCSRCDIKRQAKLCWGEIVPVDKFCSNCGGQDFYLEKADKVNIVDAHYALYLKEKAKELNTLHPEVQIWIDENSKILKLLKKPAS